MLPQKICINKNLLSSTRKAYSLYNVRIEEEKCEKAEKTKKETGTGSFRVRVKILL